MRQALSARNLDWEPATFVDYPSIRYWRYWPRVAIESPVRYLAINRLALRLIKQQGITHIHLHNPFQAATFHRAIEQSDVAVVYRCGDVPTIHNAFYRNVWQWIFRRGALIVTESEFIRAQLLSMGVDASRTRLIRTPAPRRTPSRPFRSPITGAGPRGMVFGYVGQFAAHKGVGLLLEAFSIVSAADPTARLLIAAPIADDYAQTLIGKWSASVANGSIHFLDAVEDVPGLLRECDVHVAPTVKPEPYGLVAVEAKQAGIPSIVFAEGGLRELVEDGLEGIALSEKTPRALAEAMLTYCRSPERVQSHGARAQASLEGRLQIDRHDDSWWESYRQTSGNHPCDAV